jgi:hypothetical protein
MRRVTSSSDSGRREPPAERRRGPDRRRSTWHALLFGGLNPRRRNPRRGGERHIAALDWHPARWFGVALTILLLSVADAFLTLTLINLGADEINPVMEPLVTGGSGRSFAVWKLAMTALGVVTLTLLARMRAFGRIPVGAILYAVLAVYVVLVGYELWLLERLSIGAFDPP